MYLCFDLILFFTFLFTPKNFQFKEPSRDQLVSHTEPLTDLEGHVLNVYEVMMGVVDHNPVSAKKADSENCAWKCKTGIQIGYFAICV